MMHADPAGKAALRATVRLRRDNLDAEARRVASERIAERAIALLDRLRPHVLAGYGAIRSEVDPAAILAWAHDRGVTCVLPVVGDATTLVFRHYAAGDPLAAGAFGTRGPHDDAPELDPDVLLVPLIAFDRLGNRLGHGGGFYDRGVARLRAAGHQPVLVGLAFATQEAPSIPAEAHDIRLDWIVTEIETLDVRAPKQE
jgi:5-formyltetrahydrofolate cyclo-ligase